MAKSKKEKTTKDLTKGLKKFLANKDLIENNGELFEKVLKKVTNKPD